MAAAAPHVALTPRRPRAGAARAQAEDLAIEDALTVLDKALQGGKAPVDAYIKQSRALCRSQFFARARGLKIAQQQARFGGGGAAAGAAAPRAAGPRGTPWCRATAGRGPRPSHMRRRCSGGDAAAASACCAPSLFP